jgi:signal peptidase II
VLAALVTIGDQIVKQVALQSFPSEDALVRPDLIELAVHKNYGIAFDIPFRLPIVIVLTLIVVGLLIRIAYQNWERAPEVSTAAGLIVFGAIGNLADRIIHGFTIDYLILLRRSAINLSDVLIVLGVILLLLSATKKHRHVHEPSSHDTPENASQPPKA